MDDLTLANGNLVFEITDHGIHVHFRPDGAEPETPLQTIELTEQESVEFQEWTADNVKTV